MRAMLTALLLLVALVIALAVAFQSNNRDYIPRGIMVIGTLGMAGSAFSVFVSAWKLLADLTGP